MVSPDSSCRSPILYDWCGGWLGVCASAGVAASAAASARLRIVFIMCVLPRCGAVTITGSDPAARSQSRALWERFASQAISRQKPPTVLYMGLFFVLCMGLFFAFFSAAGVANK